MMVVPRLTGQILPVHLSLPRPRDFPRFQNQQLSRGRILTSIQNLGPILRSGVMYNASAVKIYNATRSLMCLDNKNVFFVFEKSSNFIQRWCCSCKFRSRGIGSCMYSSGCECCQNPVKFKVRNLKWMDVRTGLSRRCHEG
jgi:hypothetical protein